MREFIISTATTAGVILALVVLRRLLIISVGKIFDKNSAKHPDRLKRYNHYKRLARGGVNLLFWGFTVIVLLDYTGLGNVITALVTFAGVGSLVIGLAAQDVFKDVIAGFILISEDNLAIDDYVEVNGFEGTVEDIKLRNLYLRTYSGQLVAVPTGEIGPIVNYSRGEAKALVSIDVSSYEDIESVKNAIRSAGKRVKTDERAAKSEAVVDGITALGGNWYRVRSYVVTDGNDYFYMQRKFSEYIIEELKRSGVDYIVKSHVNLTDSKRGKKVDYTENGRHSDD